MFPPTPSPSTLPAHLGRQVDQLCALLNAGWNAGAPPALESLLDKVASEARPELLRRALLIDVEHRRIQGRVLTAAEARQRFGGLGPWAVVVLDSLPLDDSSALILEVIDGPLLGRSFQLTGHSAFYVGRGPDGVQLALEGDTGISRLHFLLEYNPPRARLSDLRSKNGTYLNGKKVDQGDLRDGDEVRAGRTTLKVRLPQGERTVTVDCPEPEAPLMQDPEPRLPGYLVECELGRGGMGVVYKARRVHDNFCVALKRVLPAVAPRPETLARFQREMAILRRLTHPNIVRFLDSGEVTGMLYFVMEYVEGPSAAALVKREGPLGLGRVVTLGCQLLDALAYAHAEGFVHRDVKPGNVILAQSNGDEVLQLADFGLARAYQESAMSGLTLSGTPGGTPGFMAPEQVVDFRGAGPPADQYAVGATLYYMLTGQPIYEPAAQTLDLLMRIINSEPIPLRPGAPALPKVLGEVLRRSLARDPRRRYPNALAMREALQSAI